MKSKAWFWEKPPETVKTVEKPSGLPSRSPELYIAITAINFKGSP